MSEFRPLGEIVNAQTRFPRPSDAGSPTAADRPSQPYGRTLARPARVREPLTAESTRHCRECGRMIGTFPLEYMGRTVYWWQRCGCQDAPVPTMEQRIAMEAARAEAEQMTRITRAGLNLVQHLTLETFQPGLLRPGDGHPFPVAVAWLTDAMHYGAHADYRDPASPPAALFFYSAGKGRGKTHLAAGLALEAVRQQHSASFLQEHSYLERRWSCPLEALEDLTALPGDQAWLTVIDDIGQRQKTGPSTSDAWYAVFNRRWLKAGWTVITSNKTPDELLAQGTINDATYSRLAQMMRGQMVVFDGEDRRWEVLA